MPSHSAYPRITFKILHFNIYFFVFLFLDFCNSSHYSSTTFAINNLVQKLIIDYRLFLATSVARAVLEDTFNRKCVFLSKHKFFRVPQGSLWFLEGFFYSLGFLRVFQGSNVVPQNFLGSCLLKNSQISLPKSKFEGFRRVFEL